MILAKVITTTTTTLMGPSMSRLWSVSVGTESTAVNDGDDDGAIAAAADSGVVVPVPRDDEPNLYNYPPDIFPYYRPLPTWGSILVYAVSTFISFATTTWRQGAWLRVLIDEGITLRSLLWAMLKAATIGFIFSALIQEIYLPPSRILTRSLMDDYFLPSKLSKYEQVSIDSSANDIGVHFLKFDNLDDMNMKKIFDAVYVNHGFGASSLSWLPALPSLVKKLRAPVGLGHDAAGFGFTDRPDDLAIYRSTASAKIGNNILNKHTETTENGVALFGHSLGALATLIMATKLPMKSKKFIVLSAPALGLSRGRSYSTPDTVAKLEASFLGRIGEYILRRIVGIKGFWSFALKNLVWGDRSKVTESDALRFEWPSIGLGWERGLLAFARAQNAPTFEDSDTELVDKVTKLPNTTLTVIYGSKDNVVRPQQIESFFKDFPSVQLVKLEGAGHDSHEEQKEEFIQTVVDMLDKKK